MADARLDAEHPPAWVFMSALVLAVTLMLSLYMMGSYLETARGDAEKAHYLNTTRLQPRKTDEQRVVLIGSSRLRSALAFDHEFEPNFGPNTQIRVVRVTRDDADLDLLTPAFAEMQQHPPTLLIVESELLTLHRPPDAENELTPWERTRQFKPRIRLTIAKAKVWLGFAAPPNENTGDPGPYPRCDGITFEESDRRSHERAARRWRVALPSQYQPYLEAFEQLQARGTRVVLLDLPQSQRALPYPHVLSEGIAAVKQKVISLGRLEHWVSPAMPASHFCDAAHARAEGRDLLSQQIATRVLSAIRTSP